MTSRADAIAALHAADPVLAKVIDEVGSDGPGDLGVTISSDRYGALVRSIVGQQLSTRSAMAIYARLTDRFGGRTPTPVEVLEDDPDELREAVGLSHAKAAYLRSLAEHVLDGSLDLDHLDQLPDEDVIAALTAVRGIGPWSAHMFLIFRLGRPDVLPVGDLGIRRAIRVHYALPELPGPAEIERIAEPWRPHRTLASLYLWRSLQVTPV
ncbi:MAG: DNA-3-methyladenine glycosylase family protein [Solirubrobacteraceae bacterium]